MIDRSADHLVRFVTRYLLSLDRPTRDEAFEYLCRDHQELAHAVLQELRRMRVEKESEKLSEISSQIRMHRT